MPQNNSTSANASRSYTQRASKDRSCSPITTVGSVPDVACGAAAGTVCAAGGVLCAAGGVLRMASDVLYVAGGVLRVVGGVPGGVAACFLSPSSDVP